MFLIPRKLPSRRTMGYIGVTAGILGSLRYNRYRQEQVCAGLVEQVEVFAEEPLAPEELPTRVCLYLLPSFDDLTTYRAEQYLNRFILPVFRRSGIDVRVVQADSRELLKEKAIENIPDQKTLPPFHIPWRYARHIAVGSEAMQVLLDAQQVYYEEAQRAVRDYDKDYEQRKRAAWIFTPKYEPPAVVEPLLAELPLNVTKGFKQLHLTAWNLVNRVEELERTGSQVVNLIRELSGASHPGPDQ